MATSTSAVQTIDVVTPAAGESVTEGTILEWRVKGGDSIKVDDTIVEISTDKVDVELPSPASGTVSEILVEEGETVTVGQVIARIYINGAAPTAEASETAVESTEAAAAAVAETADADAAAHAAEAADAVAATAVDSSQTTSGVVDVLTPAARAPATGSVSEILVEEGDTVTVGQVIARIAVGEAEAAAQPGAAPAQPAAPPA